MFLMALHRGRHVQVVVVVRIGGWDEFPKFHHRTIVIIIGSHFKFTKNSNFHNGFLSRKKTIFRAHEDDRCGPLLELDQSWQRANINWSGKLIFR